MNSIILCEGFDDAYILGYYLFKTCEWNRAVKPNFAKEYNFPSINKHNQGIEYYYKDDNKLAIWSVGGKDAFDKPIKFVSRVNKEHPKNGINNIFILSDIDNSSIDKQLKTLNSQLNAYDISIDNLTNNEPNVFDFIIEDESYKLSVIPIIIPFEEEGALETILIKAIEEDGTEEKFIVSQACEYIDNIKNNIAEKYLKSSRLILKAKFSSVISVTNPDRSTAIFNKLLISHEWEKAESVKNHFNALNKYL